MCWRRIRRPPAERAQELLDSPGTVARPSATKPSTGAGIRRRAGLFQLPGDPEVVDSLTRPNASFTSQRLPYRSGLTIPGRIYGDGLRHGRRRRRPTATRSMMTRRVKVRADGMEQFVVWAGRWGGYAGTYEYASTLLKGWWNDSRAGGCWQRLAVLPRRAGRVRCFLNVRYGSGGGGPQLRVLVNRGNVSGSVSLPGTGAFTTYATYAVNNVAVGASGTATVRD